VNKLQLEATMQAFIKFCVSELLTDATSIWL